MMLSDERQKNDGFGLKNQQYKQQNTMGEILLPNIEYLSDSVIHSTRKSGLMT